MSLRKDAEERARTETMRRYHAEVLKLQQMRDVNKQALEDQKAATLQAMQDHFLACKMPPKLIAPLTANIPITPANLRDFKKEFLMDVKQKRNKITDIEAQLAANKAGYFDVKNQKIDPNRYKVTRDLEDELKQARAELEPLLKFATPLAGESSTLRTIASVAFNVIGFFSSWVAAALWIGASAGVTAAPEIAKAAVNPDPISKVSAASTAASAILEATPKAIELADRPIHWGEFVYNDMSEAALSRVFDKLIDAVDTDSDSAQAEKKKSSLYNRFNYPFSTRPTPPGS